MASKGRFRKGQTVYIRYHAADLLRGLMADPDGPLVFEELIPPVNRWGKYKCRLRPPVGAFLDGSKFVDVPSAMVVVVPRSEQVAEEQERIAAGARR